MSVVTGRALPSAADGQKPVQRRVLYAMHRMGLYRGPKHVKSAREPAKAVVDDLPGRDDATGRSPHDCVIAHPWAGADNIDDAAGSSRWRVTP